MDAAVRTAHHVVHLVDTHWADIVSFMTLKLPYMREMAILCNSINGAMAAFKQVEPGSHWMYSLVFSVIRTYGGGFLAPLLMGKPSGALNNDIIIFTSLLVWYLIHYLRFDRIFNLLPVKLVWMFFLGVFRANAQTAAVSMANSVFQASAYYPIPFFGPIVVGTLLGALGQFLPFDKGLSALKNGVPWNVQGALYTSAFYHFMVNDTHGCVGMTLRSIFGPMSASTVVTVIAIAQVIQLEAHALISPDCNLFAPIHHVLYAIFRVNGPKPVPTSEGLSTLSMLKKVDVYIDLLRVGLVLLVVFFHCVYCVLPVSVPTIALFGNENNLSSTNHQWTSTSLSTAQIALLQSKSLGLNEAIGSCQWLNTIRPCHPLLLRFEIAQCDPSEHVCNDASDSANPRKDRYYYRLATYTASVDRSNYKASEFVAPLHTLSLALVPDSQVTKNHSSPESVMLVFSSEGGAVLVDYSDTNDVHYVYVTIPAVHGFSHVQLQSSSGAIEGATFSSSILHSEL